MLLQEGCSSEIEHSILSASLFHLVLKLARYHFGLSCVERGVNRCPMDAPECPTTPEAIPA